MVYIQGISERAGTRIDRMVGLDGCLVDITTVASSYESVATSTSKNWSTLLVNESRSTRSVRTTLY